LFPIHLCRKAITCVSGEGLSRLDFPIMDDNPEGLIANGACTRAYLALVDVRSSDAQPVTFGLLTAPACCPIVVPDR
jgi:hypothetical protein